MYALGPSLPGMGGSLGEWTHGQKCTSPDFLLVIPTAGELVYVIIVLPAQ